MSNRRMPRSAGLIPVTVLVVAGVLCAPVPAAMPLPEYRPIDAPWAEKTPPKIEWQPDWDATLKANTDRWQKELRAEKDRPLADLILYHRCLVMVQAMLERNNPPEEGRIKAYQQIADLLNRMGMIDRANAYRRKLVDEFPGRLGVAAEALFQMLQYPDTPHRAAWVEYATDRLIALNDAGALPDRHPWLLNAFQHRLTLHVDRQELTEAHADLQALARRVPKDDPFLVDKQAELLYAGGRAGKALRRYEDMSEEAKKADTRQEDLSRYSKGAETEIDPSWPQRLELEMKWDFLATRHFGAEGADLADELLAGAAGSPALVGKENDVYMSVWRAAMGLLRSQEADPLKAMRTLQETKAPEVLTPAVKRGEFPAAMAAFRRCPYAPSVLKALLASAEGELRAGRSGLALRAFRDIKNNTDDADLALRATVGAAMALAQAGDAQGLAEATKAFKPDAALPWMGKTAPAAEVLQRLKDSLPPAPATPAVPPAAGLAQRTLQLPSPPAWAPGQLSGMPSAVLAGAWYLHGTMVPVGGDLVLCGPNLLAKYAPGQTTPAWVRTALVAADWSGTPDPEFREDYSVPAAVRPAVEGGTIFCRWGLDRKVCRPDSVAAFDLATGQMLWAADEQDLGGELEPISDPAVEDGRLYLLAARTDVEVNTPIYLVCLDAADGHGLWRRLLAHQTLTSSAYRPRGFNGVRVNFTTYGSAVTVQGGEVYCSTSAGFVARCDARDGMVEWTRSYPQSTGASFIDNLARRQGAAPAVLGGRVVFAPRDCRGAFALDRQSGQELWDNPFLPSDNLALAGDGAMILSDDERLCAVSPDSGEALWTRRIEEGIQGRPIVTGQSIYVGTPSGIAQLNARTGAHVGTGPWQAGGELEQFILRDGLAEGIGALSAAAPAAPLAAAAGANWAGKGAALSLPLEEVFQVPRVTPRFFQAPAGSPAAGPGDRVYVVCPGTIECMEITPALAVRWRTVVPAGVRDVSFFQGLLLAGYDDRLAAYQASDGRLKWQYHPGIAVEGAAIVGPYLVLRSAENLADVEVVDLATGRAMWRRRIREGVPVGEYPNVLTMSWDGQNLVFFIRGAYNRRSGAIVTCRPADGQILKVLPLTKDLSPFEAAMRLEGNTGWYLGSDGKIREFSVDGSTPTVIYDVVMPVGNGYGDWRIHSIRPTGQWLAVEYHRENNSDDIRRTYILKRGQKDYVLTMRRLGEVRGDRFYDMTHNTLTIVDLNTRKEAVSYQAPNPPRTDTTIVDFQETGETLSMASFVRHEWGRYAHFHLDRFERATGKQTASQDFDLAYWSDPGHDRYRGRRLAYYPPAVLWRQEGFLLGTPLGLYGFAPVPPTDRPIEVRVIPAKPQQMDIDGRLTEWDAGCGWAMTPAAAGGAPGRLMACQDTNTLYLAATCEDGDARPLMGSERYGAGDFLEVSIRSVDGKCRFMVGLDDNAQPRVLPMFGGKIPADMRVAVTHDPVAGRTSYELSIPHDSIVARWVPGRDRIRLAARLWGDRQGLGQAPAASLGGGLGTASADTDRHDIFQVGELTWRAEQAALAVAREAPNLPECESFLRDYFLMRSRLPGERSTIYDELLKAHAASPAALRLMALLDQGLRRKIDDDPAAEVVKIAKAAGVSDAVCQQYLEMTKSYLSQWVYMRQLHKDATIAIWLNDGPPSDEGSEHRVTWGLQRHDAGKGGTSYRRFVGPIPAPAAQWFELRVPLIWLDMHDKPIGGLTFICFANLNLDRTAVGRGGGEQVLIDDALPPGTATGRFTWDVLAKSGSKSLAKTGNQDVGPRLDVTFPQPVAAHLAGLPPRPAADAPRAIAAIRKNMPQMADSELGWSFYQALAALEAGADPAKRLAVDQWYLQQKPTAVRAMDVLLGMKKRLYEEQKDPAWVAKMDAFIRSSAVPPEVAYLFRSRQLYRTDAFVRNWLAIGPFPSGKALKGDDHPLESEPLDMSRQYDGMQGTVSWRPVETNKEWVVDLDKFFGGKIGHCMAFAVCWVYCEQPTPAFLELGDDDWAKVWVNRRLALDDNGQQCRYRGAQAKVTFPAGWSELLVKCTNVASQWSFCLEIYALDGDGMPKGMKLTTTQPAGAASRPAATSRPTSRPARRR